MTARIGKSFWVGVDVSKETLEVALVPLGASPSDWRRLEVRTFKHNEEGVAAMAAWIGQRADPAQCVGVCAESTGIYSRRFAELLRGRGLPAVSIVNPARSVQFGKSCGARDKTDRVDAALLAMFGVVHAPPATEEPPEAHRRIRDLDRQRQAFVEDRSAMKSRLEQAQGLGEVMERYEAAIAFFDAQIKEIEEAMSKIAVEDPVLRLQIELLVSIPGIKEISATTITVEMGDLRRYSREEIIGYAGLFARQHQSGTSVRRKGQLARGGGARVRRVLYMGGTSLFNSKINPLAQFARELVDRGKSKMCALGAMMRKQLLTARAVVVSGKPYDPDLAARSKPAQTPPRAAITAPQEEIPTI